MKKFVRNQEDFKCDVCGQEVFGTGYTDHCPNCLWSRHVDIFPGDRQSECGGLMEPIMVDQKRGLWFIHYKCVKCGYQKQNKASDKDNFNQIIKIASNSSLKF